MAKNYVEAGNTVNVTVTAPVASGDVVIVGDLAGVAITSVNANELATLSTVGVWEIPAKGADNITQGATLYWDATAKEATTTKGTNKVLGKAWSNSPATVTTVAVRLNG